jgi:hypothetical protein
MIATVVCRCGGGVGVGCVDMQVCGIVIFALGHCVLEMKFTALMHHIYRIDTLRFAYSQLKRQAAPGVDGETWRHYGEALEDNLQNLSHRLKRGAYRAKPVRRVYIPKADGRLRPLGVTALEDKIVQRATVEVLNTIYETDFLGFSYGFRPGRNQHQALDALYSGLRDRNVNWVLDLDVRSFFDKLSHEWLVRFLQHRIADQRHFSGSILSVAFAVFHFAFEGAEQSYTSLPGCPIASKFRMQAKCA